MRNSYTKRKNFYKKTCVFTAPDAHTHTVHTSLSFAVAYLINSYKLLLLIVSTSNKTNTTTTTAKQSESQDWAELNGCRN